MDEEGTTLFRELLRLLPTARVDTYYQSGQWRKDDILVDTELVILHRLEAGAPEPPPLEEIPLPVLSKPPLKRQELRTTRKRSLSAERGRLGKDQVIRRWNSERSSASSGGTKAWEWGTSKAKTSVATEARLFEEFVSKWRLDTNRAKYLLARLVPSRRRWVLENFRHTVSALSPSAALERYISDQRAKNWDESASQWDRSQQRRPQNSLRRWGHRQDEEEAEEEDGEEYREEHEEIANIQPRKRPRVGFSSILPAAWDREKLPPWRRAAAVGATSAPPRPSLAPELAQHKKQDNADSDRSAKGEMTSNGVSENNKLPMMRKPKAPLQPRPPKGPPPSNSKLHPSGFQAPAAEKPTLMKSTPTPPKSAPPKMIANAKPKPVSAPPKPKWAPAAKTDEAKPGGLISSLLVH